MRSRSTSVIIKYIFFICFLMIFNNLFAEDNFRKNNKIFPDDCDTLYYITEEYRVEKIIKLQKKDIYLIYLTNSTRDKIYTVISVKYVNKKLSELYKELKEINEINEGEIFTFQLYYLKPHCKDDIIIGDKYFSGYYYINGEKIFLPQNIIKGDLFITPNLSVLYYINILATDINE